MTRDSLHEIKQQFTRTAEIYARMRQTTNERGLDGLVAIGEPAPTARALDVACGPGFLTLALGKRCAEATGLDATEAFLALARTEAEARGLKNVRFEAGDAEQLPFASGQFDLVTCRAAFHHFPHPERVIGEMARVTATDGRIVVADMLGSENVEQARRHDRIERLCDPTHERALPESRFAELFEQAGLAIRRRIESTLDYEVDEWIDHGAPEDAVRRQIVALFESNLPDDRTGLCVRRDNDVLHFTHRTAAFVLEHAAPG
jgi:ubiquinone/menaquinone biosynthesis C-methylase UbiE